MHRLERTPRDAEIPSRYILDEARFPGAAKVISNRKEENRHEPTANLPR